jgi:polyferredoxin
LLHRIPTPKLRVPRRLDRILRYLKYAVLLVLVLLGPFLSAGPLGGGDPWFCKYICPAGTLEGGIPLLLKNETLRQAAGFLFSWKFGVMLAILLGAVFISRCFCRYLCPLGAVYALFNRFALYQMQVDRARCVGCGKCDPVCPMALDVRTEITGGECIRCGKCLSVCPESALAYVRPGKRKEKAE